MVPIAAIQAVPIAVIAWYRLQRYVWYRYSAIVTVIMFGEDLVSTPAVAYEIANVLLRSSFDSDLFKNTIWGISQNKEAWEVTNSPDQSDGSIVFGGIIQIFINKKNGMVYDINALK